MSTKKLTDLFLLVGGNNTAEWTSPNPDELEYVNQHGLSRKNNFDSVKKSLEKLQFDYIDVLQCELTAIAYRTAISNSFRYYYYSYCWNDVTTELGRPSW
jgi:hypothetical protein